VRQFGEHYFRGLGMSTRNNALAFGYSIASTASFAVLARSAPPPSIGHIFMFVVGAGVAFAGVTALVTRGFRKRVEDEPPMVMALGNSLSLISISAGVGIVALLGVFLHGALAWLLGAMLATWTYLGVAALEVATARLLHISIGEKDPEDR
jgi:hypothetical protein